MKIFLSCLFIISCVSLFSQSVLKSKISVKLENSTYENLLSYIEHEAQIRFMYEDKLVDLSKQISVKKDSIEIYQLLRLLFPDNQITFTNIGNQIIIHRKKQKQLVSEIPKKSNNTKYKFELVYDTVVLQIFDTTRIVDTSVILVYDTIYKSIDVYNKFKIKFGIFSSIDLRNEFYQSSSDITFNLRKSKENALPGFSVNGIVYFDLKHLNLGVGIGIRQMISQFSYNQIKETVESSTQTIYIEDEYYDYYTSWKNIVTSFGDSIYVKYTDSVLVHNNIPQEIIQSKTITKQFVHKSITGITYICVPICINYEFVKKRKHSYNIELSAELDYKIHSYGFPSFTEREELLSPGFQVANFMGLAGISAGYTYKINKKYSFTTFYKLMWSAQNLYTNDQYNNSRIINSIGIGFTFK